MSSTDTLATTRLAVLGLGNMNGAILTGMLAAGLPADNVVATTRSADSAVAKADKYGVRVISNEQDPQANRTAVAEADVVLVGVKPKDIVAALRELSDALPADAVVVSVAAGVTAKTLGSVLRAGQPLVRTMPNTPLTVGSGVVGMAPGEHVSTEQADLIEQLFSGSGLVVRVEESLLPAVVATAGSAPAYLFLFAEAIAKHAEQLGLPRADAERMAAATVKGAGLMLEQGDQTAEQLRTNVMSPGGTTAKAIESFQADGLEDIVARAMDAAAARDREMGEEFTA